MPFEQYQSWLKSEWGLSLNLSQINIDPPYDPQMKSLRPAEQVGLKEQVKTGEIEADHSTVSFIHAMRSLPDCFTGKSSWEIGCGSGLVSVQAGLLGAHRVCASDIEEGALHLVKNNGQANGVQIETCVSNLFSEVPWKGPFDNILSILPQKPCPPGILPLANDGGPEGTDLLLPVIQKAEEWLAPEGSLFLFFHSLAHPKALLQLHHQYRVDILSMKTRIFTMDDYPALEKMWKKRNQENTSYFESEGTDRFGFICLVARARRAS